MPDTKLTWPALREHLRTHLAIYIACVVLMLVLTSLLWSVTEPRIPTDRSVVICLADDVTVAETLDGVAARVLARARAFDDTLEAVSFQNLMYQNQSEGGYGEMLLLVRMAAGEIDAFLAGPEAMEYLVAAGGLMTLDEPAARGWLSEYNLEPCYATIEDDETGKTGRFLAGFRLDSIDELSEMGAMNNEGAYLAVAANCDNPETTLEVIDILLDELTKEAANDQPED